MNLFNPYLLLLLTSPQDEKHDVSRFDSFDVNSLFTYNSQFAIRVQIDLLKSMLEDPTLAVSQDEKQLALHVLARKS